MAIGSDAIVSGLHSPAVAWTTRTMHLSAAMKQGKPLELDCRDTVIWEKRGGRWLIAHEHFSAPLP